MRIRNRNNILKPLQKIRLKIVISITVGIAGLLVSSSFVQADIGPGECVQISGTCGDPPGSGGDPYYARTYVDPAIEEARRQAQEAEKLERERILAVKKKNQTPFKGVNERRRNARHSIGGKLFRIDSDSDALVKAVTFEQGAGIGGSLFVPDTSLGNIVLARPVNPTMRETKVAAEQLAKSGAVLNFIKSNQGSSEDAAFLAGQAAQIMIGSRSYVHVVVENADLEFKDNSNIHQQAADVTALVNSLIKTQVAIRESEKDREEILTLAKKDIRELARLQVQISESNSKTRKKKLQERSRQLANNLDGYENTYLAKAKEEKKLERSISKTAAQLNEGVSWTWGKPILLDGDGNVIHGQPSTQD